MELCNVCGGNGVLKIPGGISTCKSCEGTGLDMHEAYTRYDQLVTACWELVRQWRAEVPAIRAEANSLDSRQEYVYTAVGREKRYEIARQLSTRANELAALLTAPDGATQDQDQESRR